MKKYPKYYNKKTLLEELASSSGNILENLVLIESLNQTKTKSISISKLLQESSQLQQTLDKEREVYRELAIKGATTFIIIKDLQKINNMYRFSLSYFVKLFVQALQQKAEFGKSKSLILR